MKYIDFLKRIEQDFKSHKNIFLNLRIENSEDQEDLDIFYNILSISNKYHDFHDIDANQSLIEIWQKMKQFVDNEQYGIISEKINHRENMKILAQESEIIFEQKDDKGIPTGFLIVVPKTAFSYLYWRGEISNFSVNYENLQQSENCYHLEKFLKDAHKKPFFLFILPDGSSYSLTQTGYLENIKNKMVTRKFIEKYWIYFQYLEKFLPFNYYLFNQIPESRITEKTYLSTLKSFWGYDKYEKYEKIRYFFEDHENVDKTLFTPEIYHQAIMISGIALKYTPKNIITRELCLQAVKNNGESLQYVPKKFQDDEIYKSAVMEGGGALAHIPYEKRTRELCEIAIQKNAFSMKEVPDIFLDEDFYDLALKSDGSAIGLIPKHLVNMERCVVAVMTTGNAIEYIPKEFKTKEIYELACYNDYEILKRVPEDILTTEMAINVFKNAQKKESLVNSFGIDFPLHSIFRNIFPKEIFNEELCQEMIRVHCYNINVIPVEWQTYKMYRFAIEHGFDSNMVPIEMITEELHLIGLQHFDSRIPNREYLITKEICELAVSKNEFQMCGIPEEFKTNDLLKYVQRKTYNYNLEKIREEFKENSVNKPCDLNKQ